MVPYHKSWIKIMAANGIDIFNLHLLLTWLNVTHWVCETNTCDGLNTACSPFALGDVLSTTTRTRERKRIRQQNIDKMVKHAQGNFPWHEHEFSLLVVVVKVTSIKLTRSLLCVKNWSSLIGVEWHEHEFTLLLLLVKVKVLLLEIVAQRARNSWNLDTTALSEN